MLAWDNTTNKPIKHHQDKKVISTREFSYITMIVEGLDFNIKEIIFENSML